MIMKRIVVLFLVVLSSVIMNAQEVRDTIVVADDWRYEGQWPKGEGVLYHEYDGMYWGTFNEATPVCCKHCDYFGNRYNGNFNGFRYDGYGVMFFNYGEIYEGKFQNGEMTGIGKLFRNESDIYVVQQGEFRNGEIVAGKEFHFPKEKAAKMIPSFPEQEMTADQKSYLKKALKGTAAPGFKGGDMNDFSLWVNQNLRGLSADVQGRVVVSFVVNEDGRVVDVSIVESSSFEELDSEVVRVISSAPKFKPATINGHKVSKNFRFPVVRMPK